MYSRGMDGDWHTAIHTNMGLCLAFARRRQQNEIMSSFLALPGHWVGSNNLKNSAMNGDIQREAQGSLCFLPSMHLLAWPGRAGPVYRALTASLKKWETLAYLTPTIFSTSGFAGV